MEEGHAEHGWASTMALVLGEPRHPLSQLKDGCPISMRVGRGVEQWQEREFWKGVAWLGHIVIKDSEGHHFSLKLSAVRSPGQGAQGCPLGRAGELLLLPPPMLAPRKPDLSHPSSPAWCPC